MKQVIVKVQLAISPPNGPIMVYDFGRNRLEMKASVSDAIKTKIGPRTKSFFYAVWKDGSWVLGEEAPWQEW